MRQIRMLRSKKGDDMIVDFWSIFIFAIICILFFVLFSINKSSSEKTLEAEFSNKDANYMLQSFLRAPAIGIDDSKTVADIIAEDDLQDDFTDTKMLFEQFFGSMISYNIYLDIQGEHSDKFKKKLGESFVERIDIMPAGTTSIFMIRPKGESYSAVSYIPGYEKRIYITLDVDETAPMNNEKVTKE